MSDKKEDSLTISVRETKVSYRYLGRSGLKVSVPILGAMSLGIKEWAPWVIEEDEALSLLKAAWEQGLNTWDTANMYSGGVSEEIIGKALQQFRIPRHKVVILTKCHTVVGEPPSVHAYTRPDERDASKDYVNQGGLSRAAIFNQVNASLRRLDTDYIDLLQIHRFDRHTPIEETMEALHDLVKAGKVRYIGASSMWAYQFAMMQAVAEKRGWTKFVSMQGHYNMLYREEEREMNRFCNETGVGLIPWGPLCSGSLARPYQETGTTVRSSVKRPGMFQELGHTEADRKTIERVGELAEKHGWPMSHVALAWINKRVTAPIIGFSSVKRMEEAVSARGKTLTEEEEKYLEEPYVSRAVIGHQ